MMRFCEYTTTALICFASVILVGLQIKPSGWILLMVCAGLLAFCSLRFARHFGLIVIALFILGLAPIGTDINTIPALTMATVLSLALLLPYIVSRFIYKDGAIRFQFHHGRGWYKKEILYIVVTAAISYLLLPFYLQNTGAYLNWPNPQDFEGIVRLFIGTNALGIWDELFFICVILGLMRQSLPFWCANGAQAVLFTAFLHELGFVSWAFIPIYLFALLQGYIFAKTESLFYVITIHLTLDLVLFLALLNAYNPAWVPIFIT